MAEEEKATDQDNPDDDDQITSMANFPLDLISEIFLRLPVESLGRFKSVCKNWNSSISTHKFAKSHVEFCSTDPKNPKSLLFVTSCRGLKSSFFSFHGLLDHDHDEHDYDHDHDHAIVELIGDLALLPGETISVLGSSYGLVCIGGWNSRRLIHVLNPITKECRSIPQPRSVRCVHGYGFAFVPSIDAYKIVLLAEIPGCNRKRVDFRVYVFSSRVDQWKELDIFDTLDCFEFRYHDEVTNLKLGALWNDAFYWIDQVSPQGFSLLRFDVILENISKGWDLKKHEKCLNDPVAVSISVTKSNHLCVCQMLVQSMVEMWMLEAECGDWKLIHRLETRPPTAYGIGPLGVSSNGHLFLRCWVGSRGNGSHAILVDTDHEPPSYHLITKREVMFVASFIPSLISPHHGGQ